MEIYQRNLDLLIKLYPNIYKILDCEQENIDVKVNNSKDGNKSLIIKKDNRKLYIHGKMSPIYDAKNWADSLEIKDDSVIIVFGFGLGYHINEIIKRISENNKLILIEPNISIFKEAIKCTDYTEIFACQNLYLLIGDIYEQKKSLWGVMTWYDFGKIITNKIPNYDKLFVNEYINFLNLVKDLNIYLRYDRNTSLYFSKRWQENVFKNFSYLFNSTYISDFFNLFIGKPVIIVSAGPSLSKNVKYLKYAKEHAVIICVGTALKVLLKEKIEPDFIVTLDGGIANYKHFQDINYNNIPVIYIPIVNYHILDNHSGKKIITLANDNYINEIFDKYNIEVGKLSMGQSVANFAFSIAQAIGGDPIIFIGQDLAFTDNKSHSTGTLYEKIEIAENIDIGKENSKYLMVEDIYGNEVLTDRGLYGFLTWFENAIANDRSNRKYIDATEGGAKIKGTTIMSLEDVIETYCKENLNVTDNINRIFDNRKKFPKEYLNEIIEEISEIKDSFNQILQVCKKAKNISSELYDIYATNRYDSVKKINTKVNKLQDLDDEITENIESFNLINHILQPVIYKTLNTMNEKEDESEKEKGLRVAEKSILLYENLIESIEFVEPLLEYTIKETKKINFGGKDE